jgi:hypothetical protein
MRTLKVIIGLIVTLFLLTACTVQPGGLAVSGAQDAPRPEGAKTVLRVGTGDSGEGLTPHFKIIEQFEAANEDIQVQVEPVGSGDYYARILTQIAAGDPPDLLQIGDDAVPMFVDRGAFVPLDEFIAGADFPLDTGIYLPGVLEPGSGTASSICCPRTSRRWPSTTTNVSSTKPACPTRRMAGRGTIPGHRAGVDPDRRRRQTVQWGVQLPGGRGRPALSTGWRAAGGQPDQRGRRPVRRLHGFAGSAERGAVLRRPLQRAQGRAPAGGYERFGGGNSEFDSGGCHAHLWPLAAGRHEGEPEYRPGRGGDARWARSAPTCSSGAASASLR